MYVFYIFFVFYLHFGFTQRLDWASRKSRDKVEKKSRNKKFSEWGWPGGQIVGAPWGSIFRLFRTSQLPYTSKYFFDRFYYQIKLKIAMIPIIPITPRCGNSPCGADYSSRDSGIERCWTPRFHQPIAGPV